VPPLLLSFESYVEIGCVIVKVVLSLLFLISKIGLSTLALRFGLIRAEGDLSFERLLRIELSLGRIVFLWSPLSISVGSFFFVKGY